MNQLDLSIFKAYDIRGLVETQLTPELAYLIGRAYVLAINPASKIIAVGRDVRSSGPVLFNALVQGLKEEGCDVVDLGVISTDQLYFAVGYYGYGGGITISASHNPREYNGLKMVGAGAAAISADTGLIAIKETVDALYNHRGVRYVPAEVTDIHEKGEMIEDYLDHVVKFVDLNKLKPMKMAFNGNHGAVGQIIERAIVKYNLPIEFVSIYWEANGDFPQGRPDPLQTDNQLAMKALMNNHAVDLGVAWDADADRVFFFDENGEFIDGYFTAALLAGQLLDKKPGEKIIYDPRLTWAVIDTVKEKGGISMVNRVGHSFIKNRMKNENALFAGENSGHYYFRDNYFADNGLIPLFLIWEMLSQKNLKPSEAVKALKEKYFISGEINTKVEDVQKVIESVRQKYADHLAEPVDGLSVEFEDWRFNLRGSNTEPLLRLNLEAKTKELMEEKRDEVLKLIK